MSALAEEPSVMLAHVLDKEFLANLPPLLDMAKSVDEQQKKNRSRAFSAFALHNICGVSIADSAKAVIDDFDD